MVRRVARVLLLAAAAGSAACAASVRPHEREVLAAPRMSLDDDTGTSALQRTRVRTREEGHVGNPGSPGAGGGGGGCGCN